MKKRLCCQKGILKGVCLVGECEAQLTQPTGDMLCKVVCARGAVVRENQPTALSWVSGPGRGRRGGESHPQFPPLSTIVEHLLHARHLTRGWGKCEGRNAKEYGSGNRGKR